MERCAEELFLAAIDELLTRQINRCDLLTASEALDVCLDLRLLANDVAAVDWDAIEAKPREGRLLRRARLRRRGTVLAGGTAPSR